MIFEIVFVSLLFMYQDKLCNNIPLKNLDQLNSTNAIVFFPFLTLLILFYLQLPSAHTDSSFPCPWQGSSWISGWAGIPYSSRIIFFIFSAFISFFYFAVTALFSIQVFICIVSLIIEPRPTMPRIAITVTSRIDSSQQLHFVLLSLVDSLMNPIS